MSIGVSTFLSSAPSPKRLWRVGDKGSPTILSAVRRMFPAGTMNWICSLSDEGAKSRRSGRCGGTTLTAGTSGKAAIRNENMFEVLMEATKYCSLGQLTAAIPLRRDRLFEVGGQCRRNM